MVVFKAKFSHPNKSGTPKSNVNHFNYICTRSGAFYNEEQKHCCFGRIAELNINSFSEINDLELVKKHIFNKSKEKTTFYKCIVSLTEEDAIKKGFDEREKWEDLVKNNVSKLAKQMNIKIENFEYTCSVHMEKGHPHMHFMAWDKEQEILRTQIPFNNLNNIRKSLTNYVFNDELEVFFNIKNQNKEMFKSGFKSSFNELQEIFAMSPEDYKKYSEELKALDKDLNFADIKTLNVEQDFANEIMADIFRLRKRLPETGRLKYGFMDKEIKNHIDSISKKILNKDIDLRSSYLNYLDTVKSISGFSSNSKKYIDKTVEDAEKELLAFSGNQILNICKKMSSKEYEVSQFDWSKRKEEWGRRQKEKAIYEISSLLTNVSKNISRSQNKSMNEFRSVRSGLNYDMSEATRKELAVKLANKSLINWDSWEM